jgi:hypothetical protein
MAISRADKIEVRERINALKSAFSSGDVDVERVRELREHMISLGFSSLSSYFADLDVLEKSSIQPIRTYQGKLGCFPIMIRVSYDHFVYARAYDRMRFRINWRFNDYGKLQLVQSVLFKDPEGRKVDFKKNIRNLIEIDSEDNVLTLPLPVYVDSLLSISRDETSRYQALARFGYSGVKNFFSSLCNRMENISDNVCSEKSIRGLKELIDDEKALLMLGKTSRFLIRFEDNGYIRAIYD